MRYSIDSCAQIVCSGLTFGCSGPIRLFALLSLFDVLLMFVLWAVVSQVRACIRDACTVIHISITQGFNGSFSGNYISDSVTQYSFKSSLFDVVVGLCAWTCDSLRCMHLCVLCNIQPCTGL
jgi:hypothetical protein